MLIELSALQTSPASHDENSPMQYTEIFKVLKNKKLQKKFCDIFFLFLLKTLIVGTR